MDLCINMYICFDRVDEVGGGSDQAPFLFMLGVPIIWPRYMHEVSKVSSDTQLNPSFNNYAHHYNDHRLKPVELIKDYIIKYRYVKHYYDL